MFAEAGPNFGGKIYFLGVSLIAMSQFAQSGSKKRPIGVNNLEKRSFTQVFIKFALK